MADYHPLIARAVSGLEKNTGENRRALYERARVALVAQLRGVVPALEESEITRERLALEEAIRKVEAEAARQAREAGRPNPIRARRAAAARGYAIATLADHAEHLEFASPGQHSAAGRRPASRPRRRPGGACRTRRRRDFATFRRLRAAEPRRPRPPDPPRSLSSNRRPRHRCRRARAGTPSA